MRHVDALAHALVHEFGIAKGDRVDIAMRNLPEWIVTFAAILSVGAVSVSFNAWWTEGELDYALGDSGISLLFADTARAERAHRRKSYSSTSEARAPSPSTLFQRDEIYPVDKHRKSQTCPNENACIRDAGTKSQLAI